MMTPKKRNWDTPVLLIGTVGGLVFGNALAWTYDAPVRSALQRAYGMRWPDLFLVLCGVLGGLVIPGLVSALARTRPFAWGVLPLTLFWISIDLEQGYEMGWASVFRTLPETVAVLGGCLLLSSGPVTFVRAFLESRQRAAEEEARRERNDAERLLAEQVKANEVWPPPPDDPSSF